MQKLISKKEGLIPGKVISIEGIENIDKVISCLEQIGYRNGWLSKEKLLERGFLMSKNGYGQYLLRYAETGKVVKIDEE